MYILIDYITNHRGKCTMSYEDFEDLKDSVIQTLDGRGWDNKDTVDLRSIKSCVEYLTRDVRGVNFRKSKSYKKFCEYRHGQRARNL